MLEIRDLCAGYEGTERLHRLDAAFAPGELTAVIGPNGCGKSTLIKCIAGILKPSAGEILLDGVPLCARSARERARMIAYMPQSRLVPDISVRNLAMHGRYPHLGWGHNPRLEDREIVRDALQRTEMEAHANRSVAHLSGGERQRAYLAMMLAQQTPVMLLDEPTAALDLAAQFALMDLLRALCAQGRSVIVVLHDLALALEYADRVLLLRNGALAAAGTPDRIFNGETLEAVFGVRARRLEDGKYVFYSCEGNFASFCE